MRARSTAKIGGVIARNAIMPPLLHADRCASRVAVEQPMHDRRYTLSDFDYDLPPELIAQAPSPTRSGSRLLDVDGDSLTDRRFVDLPSLLREGDLAIFNDTRVIRARLHGTKPSGGRVEMLIERIVADDEALVQLKASHLPKPGGTVNFGGGVTAEVIERDDRFFRLRFRGTGKLDEWLERHGEVPLPPYITRPAGEDAQRYQTVYARHPGAVAAPTAGFHFDDATFAALAQRGVDRAHLTLHVGAGTFQPVATENLSQHRMHRESLRHPAGDRAGDRADARTRGPHHRRRHDLAARARIGRSR